MVLSTHVTTDTYNINNNTENKLGTQSASIMFLFDDFRVCSSALQASDITSLYNLYSNPGVFIPALHYSFDQWTTGTTIVQNEGTLGSAFDATLSHINIIFPPSPTGYNHLSLSAASRWYMSTSISNSIILSGNSWAV